MISETGNAYEPWPEEKPVELRLKFPFREPRDFFFSSLTRKKGQKPAKEASAAGNRGISLLENTLSSPPQFYKTDQEAKPGYDK